MPERGSITDPWAMDTIIHLDGKKVAACYAYDVPGGFVDCHEVEGDRWWLEDTKSHPLVKQGENGEPITVRRYGKVEVKWA